MAEEDNKPQEINPTAKSPSETPVKKLPRRAAGAMPVVEIKDDLLVKTLQEKFGKNILSANEINSQQVLQVEKIALTKILLYLKDNATPSFSMLTDLTAVHFPDQAEQPFEMVYQLYSIADKRRLRIKTRLADGETIPTVTNIWATANWLEREVYDLFGIHFDEHPDLRRILLPNGWKGHPLRKEHYLEYKDNEWVEENLQIRELSSDSDFIGKFE